MKKKKKTLGVSFKRYISNYSVDAQYTWQAIEIYKRILIDLSKR